MDQVSNGFHLARRRHSIIIRVSFIAVGAFIETLFNQHIKARCKFPVAIRADPTLALCHIHLVLSSSFVVNFKMIHYTMSTCNLPLKIMESL